MTLALRPVRGAAALLAALSLLAVVPSVPAAAIAPSACRVTNVDAERTWTSLPEALVAAGAGDHLAVRGVCRGNVTFDRSLDVIGIQPDGAAKPAIVGDGNGPAIRVNSGREVQIVALTITGGGTVVPDLGGGALVDGTLVLFDVTVRGNVAQAGAGAYVESGQLFLRGTTTIRNNRSTGGGGGVSLNQSELVMQDYSTIRHNRAEGYGGGIITAGHLAELHDHASIHHNTAAGNGRYGGAGAFIDFGGRLLMDGASSIHHNTTPAAAAGIFVKGQLDLAGNASVHHNTSGARRSGAIELVATGSNTTIFTMADAATVRLNTSGANGGGVVSWQGCGDNVPTLDGVAERTSGNTPKQLVLATGCGYR